MDLSRYANTSDITDNEGKRTVRLHQTNIVTIDPAKKVVDEARGQIDLDTGGWKTVTTKKRMNETLQGTGWSVVQRKGLWIAQYTRSGLVTAEKAFRGSRLTLNY
jgi:hypothetical protein